MPTWLCFALIILVMTIAYMSLDEKIASIKSDMQHIIHQSKDNKKEDK